jgi:hypothetical protein
MLSSLSLQSEDIANMNLASRFLALALSCSLLLFTTPANSQEEYAPVSDTDLEALVAPIALYPDALVAQVLGAATFPDQVVEANDFLISNPGLTGETLQRAVEQKSWDPAVQALTQFPSVLNNLAKNISWTSALGEASALQQEATLAAVQQMRAKAYAAGNLKSSNEVKVVQQSPQVIVIQPANPQVVYVPTYNPTVIYGSPVSTPGYSTGDVVAASIISFGIGVAVGAAISNSSCGYGYWGWGMSWGVRTISCGGGYYYGNPYWWGGYYPGYRPGYRPPYYPPPRPPYYGGRPPYPPGSGRPPYPRPTPFRCRRRHRVLLRASRLRFCRSQHPGRPLVNRLQLCLRQGQLLVVPQRYRRQHLSRRPVRRLGPTIKAIAGINRRPPPNLRRRLRKNRTPFPVPLEVVRKARAAIAA